MSVTSKTFSRVLILICCLQLVSLQLSYMSYSPIIIIQWNIPSEFVTAPDIDAFRNHLVGQRVLHKLNLNLALYYAVSQLYHTFFLLFLISRLFYCSVIPC